MKSLALGILIGISATLLAWLVATDIEERFTRMSARLDRHEQAISVIVNIVSK